MKIKIKISYVKNQKEIEKRKQDEDIQKLPKQQNDSKIVENQTENIEQDEKQ